MELKMSKNQFVFETRRMGSTDIATYLEARGVRFKSPVKPQTGVYRRESGMDLIYIHFDGTVTHVDRYGYGTRKIYYTIGGEAEEGWVRVIDGSYEPVLNGQIIRFDEKGNLTG